MSRTQTHPAQAANTQTRSAPTQQELNDLLEKAYAATTMSQKAKALSASLESRIATIEEVLPDGLKGQGERLVKRAMMTFSRSDKLEKCSPQSFIRCVLEAAELGLMIDGRLGHAVPFKGEASFQPDYKGIIAVAKRSKTIKDCYGDVVCEGDKFRAWREDGKNHLFHEPMIVGKRGDVIGAYAILILPDGDWRYEWMEFSELARIRSRSKASSNGPWVTDTKEMMKKTVLKRGLKTYCEDPAIVRALELDDREYEDEPAKPNQGQQSPPEGRVSLRAPAQTSHEPLPVANGNGNGHQEPEQPEPAKATIPAPAQNPDADDVPQHELDRRVFFERYDMADDDEKLMVINEEIVAVSKEKGYGPRWIASFNDKQAEAVKRIEGK